MKLTIKTTYCLVLIFAVFICSCEKIEILPPPEIEDGERPKTDTGDSDCRSMLFVMNELATLFVEPSSTESHIITDNVLDYFTNDMFARPLDQSDPNNLALDIFPTLLSNDFMELQPPKGNLEQSTHPGAFGTTISEEWQVDSEWWVLDPQNIDYGYEAASKNGGRLEIIEGRITTNTTWTNDKMYLLRGQVFVEDGVTLTIEPGTTIFGEQAVGIKAGVLCFNRGSMVNANGTPDQPIIFTSTAPPGTRVRGQWGGVMFLGRAPNAKGTDVLVEGIQGTGPDDGLYGGNDPDDPKGSFSYWRVEYAGLAVNPGNELNSITFGSIGSQTNAHHIIVSGAGDDSLEWFGGTMDISYVGVYNCLDDDLDMDSGFSGNVQYVYIVRNPYSADESGSANFEVSSSKTVGVQPRTTANISNVTLVGPEYQLAGTGLISDPKYQGGTFSKEDASITVINSIYIGCPIGFQNP